MDQAVSQKNIWDQETFGCCCVTQTVGGVPRPKSKAPTFPPDSPTKCTPQKPNAFGPTSVPTHGLATASGRRARCASQGEGPAPGSRPSPPGTSAGIQPRCSAGRPPPGRARQQTASRPGRRSSLPVGGGSVSYPRPTGRTSWVFSASQAGPPPKITTTWAISSSSGAF